MNDIRRFLFVSPLWVMLACRLLVKPIQIIDPEDAGDLRKMYTSVVRSIRYAGKSRAEQWLINHLVSWLEREIVALSQIEMMGIAVVTFAPGSGRVSDPPLPGQEEGSEA